MPLQRWTKPVVEVGIVSHTLAAGANKLGPEHDGRLKRWAAFELQWNPDATAAAGETIELYLLYALDGTNYEDGDETPDDPKKTKEGVFTDDGSDALQRQVLQTKVELLPFKYKPLLKSELGDQALTVVLSIYTFSEIK